VECPRGNGKSALTSGLGLYYLCADGEGGPEVYSAATTRDQARIVFDTSKAMADLSPELRQAFGLQVMTHGLFTPHNAGKFIPLSAEGSTLDGLNVHAAIVDELAAHRKRDVWDVIETGAGKRDQSILVAITTSGTDKAGIGYEVRGYAVDVLKGKVLDETQFGIVFGIDPEDDWRTEASLRKANPNYGVSVEPETLKALQSKAISTASAVNNFLTKHMNVWASAGSAFFNMTKWDEAADPTLKIEDFVGQPCWIGLDLASKKDICSKAYVFKKDDKHVAFFRHYLNQQAIEEGSNSQYSGWAKLELIRVNPGAATNHQVVEDEVMADLKLYDVREVAVDPHGGAHLFQRLAIHTDLVEIRQTVIGLSSPTKELEAAILDGKVLHSGDPVSAWMMSNVVCTLDAKDNVFPKKDKQSEKVDGAIALIMAHSRAALCTDIDDDAFNEFIGLKKPTTGK
jgi:phage terminase large subunit-like protein